MKCQPLKKKEKKGKPSASVKSQDQYPPIFFLAVFGRKGHARFVSAQYSIKMKMNRSRMDG
jgi:hypothetical protein